MRMVKSLAIVFLVAMISHSVTAAPITEGLVLRLDASDVTVTESGGVQYVSSWNDQSGNSNHAVQQATGLQPVLMTGATPGGTPVVNFDGVSNYMDITPNSSFDGSQITIFVVNAVESIEDFSGTRKAIQFGYDDIDPGEDTLMRTYTHGLIPVTSHNTNEARRGARATTRTTSGGFVDTYSGDPVDGMNTETFYISAMSSNADTGALIAYLMGADGVGYSGSVNNPALAVGSGNNLVRIGAGTTTTTSFDAGSFHDGQIAEVLVYNSALTSQEVDQINSYLYNKHIVPEPATLLLLSLGAGFGFCRRRR